MFSLYCRWLEELDEPRVVRRFCVGGHDQLVNGATIQTKGPQMCSSAFQRALGMQMGSEEHAVPLL
eukprot:4170431-Amphidinium_carterae.1